MRTPDRRGVSEAISFVLVFSLIVATVGAVYAIGFGGLQEVRNAEQVSNAERAFDVLAHNIEDQVRRGVPSRGTEINLAGATLAPGDPTYLNVSGTDPTLPDFTTGTYTLEPIVYIAGDTQIRYAGGAVIRVQPRGSAMLVEPNFVLSEQHVVVPVVQTDVVSGAVGGSQTVRVRTETRLQDVIVSETGGYDTVTVNVTSPANPAWYRYLESQGMDCQYVSPPSGSTMVSCTLSDVDRVHVYWRLITAQFG